MKPLHVKSIPKCSKCGSQNLAVELSSNKKAIISTWCLDCNNMESPNIQILANENIKKE